MTSDNKNLKQNVLGRPRARKNVRAEAQPVLLSAPGPHCAVCGGGDSCPKSLVGHWPRLGVLAPYPQTAFSQALESIS